MAIANKEKSRSKNHYPTAEQKHRTIALPDPQIVQSLLGERDLNLKVFEKEIGVRVARDHQGLVISGQDSEVDLAHDVIIQLKDLVLKGERIFSGDIERAIQMLASNRHLKLEDLFRDHVKISGRKYTITPKTFRQKSYLEAIKNNDLVFGIEIGRAHV